MIHAPSIVRQKRTSRMTFRSVLALAMAMAIPNDRAQALEWMYVSSPTDQRVDRFAMDGSSLGSIAVDRYEPFGVAVDSRGDVFVSDVAGGRILRYDAAGDLRGEFASGLKQPYFLAVDTADNVFASNFETNSVFAYDRSGRPILEITEKIDQPYGLAFDREGFLYVANFGSSEITRYDSSGRFDRAFTLAEGKFPVGLTITLDDRLFVSNPDRDELNEYDLTGRYVRTLTESLRTPTGLASDSKGNVYAANKGGDSVSMFDTAGSYEPGFAPAGLKGPYGVAIGVPEPSTYVLAGISGVTALLVVRHGRSRSGRPGSGKA